MQVEIYNCNNIDHGIITIAPNRLNIKYAINGTGKSSIAHALAYSSSREKLRSLMPYKYHAESPLSEEHVPRVDCSVPFNNVIVFNEDYVNQYLFQPTDLLGNSFEILVKTDDYDVQMAEIQTHINGIQETFRNNPDLDELIAELSAFISGFGKAQNGYSKTGTIGKGVAKGNKVYNVPTRLKEYTPFIQSSYNVDWLVWQSRGESFLELADKCPYCATSLHSHQQETIKLVSQEYDSKYVSELQKMLEIFRSLSEYFTDSVNGTISALSSKSEPFTSSEIGYLKAIKAEVELLHRQLLNIRSFSFSTLKDVEKVIVALRNEIIDLQYYSYVNTPYTNHKIAPLNDALNSVIEHAGQLQGAIRKQQAIIKKTITEHSNRINQFLENAGYRYKVAIQENPDTQSYKTVLYSTEANENIADIKSHLSYGERNAFALALFMFQAVKQNPDLIILDDPISSFDKNKKYAIMEMLFQGQNSLQGRNVLMLTHDFDPIIDLIHTSSIRCRFSPTAVASFLTNNNGTLIEIPIAPNDIKSFIKIADEKINGTSDMINKLIFLRRKLEVLGQKGLAWQLLSNIFHPDRHTPILQTAEVTRPFTEDEINNASEIISEYIPGFNYVHVYARAHDTSQMISLYKTLTSNYEKIQLYRIINHGNISGTVFKKFIDEAYHVENDSLFQLDPSEFPTIPDYIIALCDNGIALLENGLLQPQQS